MSGNNWVLENKGASSGSATVHDLTVEDENVLHCGVCFHPLKPPIFQCAVGHALCSSCSNKLKNARNCHLCRVAMPGGYQRCHAMEDMVNSVRCPCPHKPYGCDTRPAYHAREEHILECPHAPCHCPGDGCNFVGSVTALVEHIKAEHGWPCTEESRRPWFDFDVDLHDGFNFVTAVRGDTMYLFLLNMASTPFGHAISAVRIGSLAAAMASCSSAPAARNMTCSLELRYSLSVDLDFDNFHRSNGRSRILVQCKCPSNGLPNPNSSFQLFIPEYVGGSYQSTVHTTAKISINEGFVYP